MSSLPTEADGLVEAERLRLARELHDIVSFGFATIALHAGLATHVAESRPDQALEALQAIRTASRDVLNDLRAVLGQLRDDDAASDPARGIGQLQLLADSTSLAGAPTSLLVIGQPRPVPLAVDLAVYRIVQEALANVLRHARGATTVVTLVYDRSEVTVSIENDATGEPAELVGEGCGYGLVGMRERVEALGGALAAEGRGDGGFRIFATLPVRARR